jgi:hypothetical protein
MALSNRATLYLSSLERLQPLPLARVLEAFERRNIAPRDHWLEFHEALGYIEKIGKDRAIWGLIHVASQWQQPSDLWIEKDGAELVIACADVHPSYDYWITEAGEFIGIGGGGPCESFNAKVEQNALLWSVTKEGMWRQVLDFNDWPPEKRAELAADASRAVVSEATDRYTRCFVTKSCLMFERQTGCTVWMKDLG